MHDNLCKQLCKFELVCKERLQEKSEKNCNGKIAQSVFAKIVLKIYCDFHKYMV